MTRNKIEIRHLSKVYLRNHRLTQALQDITLNIREGEFCVIIGPSGCGKSTLLRLIAGLQQPSAGEIVLQQEDPNRPPTAMVFQEQGVLPWMTVEENVAFGLRMRRLPKTEILQRTNSYLQKTGLVAFRHAYPKELSGGMKQRVSLARAFAVDPEILLMDEPFSALDEQNKFLLQEELLRIWSEKKRTVVYVTHSIDEAILLGDRIVLLSASPGRLTSIETVPLPRPRHIEAIRTDPRSADLFLRIWQHLRSQVQQTQQVSSA